MTGISPRHKVTSQAFQSAVIDMDGALTASECVHFRFDSTTHQPFFTHLPRKQPIIKQ